MGVGKDIIEKFAGGDPSQTVNFEQLAQVIDNSFNRITIMLTALALWILFDDVVRSWVKGYLFYRRGDFKEDDYVFLDDKKMRINSIRWRQTTFVYKDENGRIRKRVVNNDKLRDMILEKILPTNGNENGIKSK